MSASPNGRGCAGAGAHRRPRRGSSAGRFRRQQPVRRGASGERTAARWGVGGARGRVMATQATWSEGKDRGRRRGSAGRWLRGGAPWRRSGEGGEASERRAAAGAPRGRGKERGGSEAHGGGRRARPRRGSRGRGRGREGRGACLHRGVGVRGQRARGRPGKTGEEEGEEAFGGDGAFRRVAWFRRGEGRGRRCLAMAAAGRRASRASCEEGG